MVFILKNLFFVVLGLQISACSSWQKNSNTANSTGSGAKLDQTTSNTSSGSEAGANSDSNAAESDSHDNSSASDSSSILPPTNTINNPLIANKPNVEFVLVLGPGAMKSLSYIGVIRELENNRIPIKQIIGIEWGALIGALYAKNAQSNFVEWQMFKFKDELLPNESFWSAKTGGDDIQNWNDFLQSSLAASNIENFKIPMKCLSYSLSSAKAVWIAQSKASEQLKKCISSFALYKPYQAWTAHLDFYNELAYELSRYKNQKIIILDSITKTNLAKDNSLSKREESLYIWQRAQQNMLSLAKTTKYFVAIDTTDYPLASASDKRDLVQQGQKAAEVLIRKIQNDYNF